MVIIILGSKSDQQWGKQIADSLARFGVDYKIHIASAHKTPKHLLVLISKYDSLNKPLVYICVAGRSNALGGFVDVQTVHPVINCPPYNDKYAGLDILSSLRMPGGVAPLTVLEPEQAAVAAAKILNRKKEILSFQKGLKEKIIKNDQELNR